MRLWFAVIVLTLWSSVMAVGVQAAAVVPWLYEVAVPVDSQSPSERKAASSKALLNLLSRITGLQFVPRTPQVAQALETVESYYSEFRFAANSQGDGLELIIQFDQQPVLELVRNSDLPIWRSVRPRVVAWIAIEEAGERRLLGSEESSLVARAMNGRARDRGIPLTLPLLDLEDRLSVSPAVVWGRLNQVLQPASVRYGGEVLLIGRVEALDTGLVRSEWEFWLSGEVIPWETAEGNLVEQSVAAIDRLADELAARQAVLGRQTDELYLAVRGIRGAAEYGALLNYLATLEVVDGVEITSLDDSRIYLKLSTRANSEQLLAVFESDQRMFEDRLVVSADTDLQLQWRQQ